MSTINERFCIVRKELKLTQTEFATMANRTRSEISNIEYNKTTPKEEVIKAVCKAHGINREYLEYGKEPMLIPRSEEEEISEKVSAILNGPPDFQRAVVKMICSRSPAELKTLEKTFMDILENIRNAEKE